MYLNVSASGDSDESSPDDQVDPDLNRKNSTLSYLIKKNEERMHMKSSKSDLNESGKKNFKLTLHGKT